MHPPETSRFWLFHPHRFSGQVTGGDNGTAGEN